MDRPSGFSDLPTVCKWLLVANVLVFLAQIFFTRQLGDPRFQRRLREAQQLSQQAEPSAGPGLQVDPEMMGEIASLQPNQSIVQEWFELDPRKVGRGQVWRLITSAFCHDRFTIWHLLINMLFLYWFGTRLENMYGAREFALFYVAAALCASFAYLALQVYTDRLTPAIGASGAVLGLAVLYTIHHPYETIRIYFLFPIQMRWLLLIYIVLDLHPVLLQLSGQVVYGNTAHAAHLGGALFGFLYHKRGWRIEPLYNRLPMLGKRDPWAKRGRVVNTPRKQEAEREPVRSTIPLFGQKRQENNTPRVVRFDPELERLELSLDEVLEKIHERGRDSLTDEEVAVLEKASRKYRDKD